VEDAIRRTLSDAGAFLKAHSVPFAVIGGIAVSVRGEPRFTADIDLVIGVEIEKGLELLAAVKGSAFAPLFQGAEEVVRRSYIPAGPLSPAVPQRQVLAVPASSHYRFLQP
jgi:hypothetical protein